MTHQVTITFSDQEYDVLSENADDNEQTIETYLHEAIADQFFISKGTGGQPITYRCSFCAKSQNQVRRLIAGPAGVYICDECIDLCNEIINEEQQSTQAPQQE